jgi:ribosomal protein S18 acetylase RimI-like enzyme
MPDYEIRELKPDELDAASNLVRTVFMEFEAPDYSAQGVETFLRFIEPDAMRGMFERRVLRFIGCFAAESPPIGLMAMRGGSHISMLFVDKSFHHQGIGKALITAALNEAGAQAEAAAVTVNSSPYAIGFYRRMGFEATNTEQTVNGIRFTPMELQLRETDWPVK